MLAAMLFYGVILWLAVQSDPPPAPLFAHFFWQDRRNQIANQRSVCNLERTSNGTDETCRLRRGEGLREAPRAQALRRAIGLAERMQSEASLGVCEDEGLRSNGYGLAAKRAVPVPTGKVGRTGPSAPTSCCAESPAERRLRCHRKNGSFGESG